MPQNPLQFSLKLEWFSTLGGLPVAYGSWKNTATRRLQDAFLKKLDESFAALKKKHPFTLILSGGAYVNRTITRGDLHSTGEGFDLTGIDFRQTAGGRLRIADHDTDPRVFAVEAHFRRDFQVLGPGYADGEHEGHLHIDNRYESLGFQETSWADVTFVKRVLNYDMNAHYPMNGDFSPDVKAALAVATFTAPEQLGGKEWIRFLDHAEELGWDKWSYL